MDYFMLRDFFGKIGEKKPFPIDVYDAASWMSISALSEESVAKGGSACCDPRLYAREMDAPREGGCPYLSFRFLTIMEEAVPKSTASFAVRVLFLYDISLRGACERSGP